MSKSNISTEDLEQRLRAYFSAETSKLQPPADLWRKLEARLEAPPATVRFASLWRGFLSPRQWKPLPALAIPVALLIIVSATWLLTATPWQAPRLTSTTGPIASNDGSAGAPLLLTVLDPSDGSVVDAESVAIQGRTHPEATVLINGSPAEVDPSGAFSLRVPLREGLNVVEITATSAGDRVVQQLGVTSASVAASEASGIGGHQAKVFVTILEPSDGSIVNAKSVPIHGKTHPEATVLINGDLAKVDPNGEFSLLVPLEEGPNALEITAVSAEHLVVQQLNVTSTSVAAPAVQETSVPAVPLFVTILDPPDGSVVTTKSVTIRGRTKGDALVMFNDKVANVGADGTFSLKVTLDEGPNAIDITALDERGLVESVVNVILEPSGADNP